MNPSLSAASPGPSEPSPRPAPPGQAPGPFDWPLVPAAEELLRRHLASLLEQNGFARRLARRLQSETGTDIFEWTDHMVLPAESASELQAVGLVPEPGIETPEGETVYAHPRAMLPRVLVRPSGRAACRVLALRPEFIADFIARHNLSGEPQGEPGSRFRRVLVAEEQGSRLEVVERRCYRGFVPAPLSGGELQAIVKARELWRTRPRRFLEEAEGFAAANGLLERVLGLVGPELGCQFFFEAEREYWQERNQAARIQKHRQDLLGLGWGNHDHHTFRSSREHFAELVAFLSRLGFEKRERYYAGAEAGWGAQVLEQPVAGIVVFSDVDLLPEETALDFSVHKLPAAPRLGTVGLWVGLHGESLLEAGMHHLEGRFDFELLRSQLKEAGVVTMNPFSDFDFLRQAFTEGERWPVQPHRLERLGQAGLISSEQFERFRKDGALGSHLENLQRHGGFKGFNQKAVSLVIAATDPRREHFAHRPLQNTAA